MPTQGEAFQLGSRTSANGMNSSKMRRHLILHTRRILSPGASCLFLPQWSVCTHPHSRRHLHAAHPASFSLMDCQRVQTAAHLSTLPTYSSCAMMSGPRSQTHSWCIFRRRFLYFLEKSRRLWAGTDEARAAPERCCQTLLMNSKCGKATLQPDTAYKSHTPI